MRLSESLLTIWLISFAILLGGCAAGNTHRPDPAQAQQFVDEALDVPEGLALVAVYGGESGALTTRTCMLERKSPVATSHYCGGTVTMVHVLPGDYQLALMRQTPGWTTVTTLNHRIDLSLAAGDTRIFKWVKDDAPFLDEISPELARPALAKQLEVADFNFRRSELNLHQRQWAALKSQLLNASETDFDPTLPCHKRPFRAKWSNASFEGRFTNCELTHGEFYYQDGTRLRTTFKRGGVGLGVLFNGMINNLIEGMPAERAGIKQAEYVHAVDGVSIKGNTGVVDQNLFVALARGETGSKVRLSVSANDDPYGARQRSVEIERVNLPGILSMEPGVFSEIHYPDGRRYRGPVTLKSPPPLSELLPLPEPKDAGDKINRLLNLHGQLSTADGSGFLGVFIKGQPEGHGYCYRNKHGEPCFYANGMEKWRGDETPQMAPYIGNRNADDILDSLGDLPQPVAIDLLRKRWVDALMTERWDDYLIHMAELQTIGFDTGIESIYFEGRALQHLGWPEQAHEKYQAYINLAGRSGASYADALSFYSQIKGDALYARQQRLAQMAEARDKRRDFCRLKASKGATLCGCLEFGVEISELNADQCLN